jgi:hypothetical protein
VQSDWGGKCFTLNKYLSEQGITHRISCPHTHQQNGAIGRKHQHIVETGHSSLSSSFWADAFQTSCYLINRMPTPLVRNKSPFEVLFQTQTDYSFLHVFKCACWPNLLIMQINSNLVPWSVFSLAIVSLIKDTNEKQIGQTKDTRLG